MDYTNSETFDNAAITAAAMKLITENLDEAKVHVSVEYRRKGALTTGGLDDNSFYRDYNDEYVVNVEVRVSYDKDENFKKLEALAMNELDDRDSKARSAARAAQVAQREAKIAELEAQLSELRK